MYVNVFSGLIKKKLVDWLKFKIVLYKKKWEIKVFNFFVKK